MKELLDSELIQMKVEFTTAEAQLAMELVSGCGEGCTGLSKCEETPG